MTTSASPRRGRTRFERSLFLGIVVGALVLGAVSMVSLLITSQNLRSMFERLSRQTGSETVRRDLAFFARRNLDDLARATSGALEHASADCTPDPAPAALDCVIARLVERPSVPELLTLRCLHLYQRRERAWVLLAERCTEHTVAAEADASQPPVDEATLEGFLANGVQPQQRRIGRIESLAKWAGAGGAGEPRVLVAIAVVDSAFGMRWSRSVANVERPSFAPFLAQLVWRQSVWLLVGIALVTVVGVFVSRVLAARVSQPLSDLVGAMGEVSRGNLAYRTPPVAQEEFGLLAASFNSMTENLERLNREARETARIRREMEMAREIQLKLFPQELPRMAGFDLYATNVSSLEVSGDYYDVLPWGDAGSIALAMADVSGKGVPAALLMSNIQACLHSQAVRPPEDPAAWMASMNRQLFESIESGRFVTFFLAVFAPAADRLTYVNGGHNPPLLFRSKGGIEELTEGGPLVGALPDARYVHGEVVLSEGDVLLIYTDGVTEAATADGDQFGEARLAALLREVSGTPAAEIGRRVLEEVRRHSGVEHQADDMTLIVLRRVERS